MTKIIIIIILIILIIIIMAVYLMFDEVNTNPFTVDRLSVLLM